MLNASAWPQDEDESLSLGELLASSSGRWTVALEVIATVFMLPFMYIGAAAAREPGRGVRAAVAALRSSQCTLSPHAPCWLHRTA